MALERFAAAWREAYVTQATEDERRGAGEGCVFCRLASLDPGADTGVVARDELTYTCLNAYPYGSGHLLVLPRAHHSGLADLSDELADALFAAVRRAAGALERAYGPDGLNVGFNLGRAAGAGIPAHLHAHVLPRWSGDTNFMTSIAETRVLPESLASTWAKVSAVYEKPGS